MIREFNGIPAYVAVISAHRSDNVEHMTEMIGEATWHVPQEEMTDYLRAGASAVGNGAKNCMPCARNPALRYCFENNVMAIQFDDDLKKCEIVDLGGNKQRVTGTEIIEQMVTRLDRSDYKLAGVAPTPNAYFTNKRSSTNLFVIGSAIAIKPCGLLFDERFKLKSDYDYTMQHITNFGGVLRCDDLLLTFEHYSNDGGCEAYRNDEINGAMVDLLMEKWPGWFRLNPRRPGEVIMKVPKRKREYVS